MEHPEIRRADWGQELYLLDKYDSRLFDRAGEELREGLEKSSNQQAAGEFQKEWVQLMHARYDHIPTFAKWEPGRYSSAAFSDEAAKKWFTRVTDAEFVGRVLFQFAQAWVGAQHTCQVLSTTSLDDVRRFFAHFKHPLIDESLTTESVASYLGLRPSGNH